jgi:hypothetical protein
MAPPTPAPEGSLQVDHAPEGSLQVDHAPAAGTAISVFSYLYLQKQSQIDERRGITTTIVYDTTREKIMKYLRVVL